MTTCKVIGEQNLNKGLEIEFLHYVDPIKGSPTIKAPATKPNQWLNLELIYKSTDGTYDIIFAYDDERSEGGLYLGFWNDGIVK